MLLPFALAAQNVKKVAVLEPVCRDGSVNSFYSQMVRGEMESAISSTEEYQAFDRTALDKIMEEHKFQRSGVVSDSNIKQLGVMAGVDYILVSEVSAFDGYLSVIVKILNVESGQYDKTANEVMELTPPKVKNGCSTITKQMFGFENLDSGARKGELQLPQGRYVGEIVANKPHGKGIIYYKSDDSNNRVSYDGDWVNGKRDGYGTITWKDGDKYVGNWKDDKENGYGTYYYSDGDKYVGNWKDGEENGYGTYYYDNGDRREGYWVAGNENGRFTYYWADGTFEYEKWVNGELIEEGGR